MAQDASRASADDPMTAQLMELTTTQLGKQYTKTLLGLARLQPAFPTGDHWPARAKRRRQVHAYALSYLSLVA